MNSECYTQGSCVKCGCQTTHLQMANKKCDGDCYPPMMNKVLWENFKMGMRYPIDAYTYWSYITKGIQTI